MVKIKKYISNIVDNGHIYSKTMRWMVWGQGPMRESFLLKSKTLLVILGQGMLHYSMVLLLICLVAKSLVVNFSLRILGLSMFLVEVIQFI